MKKTVRPKWMLKLAGLLEDLLYQVYENEPDDTEEEAFDTVLDHAIMIITEMDDDAVYEDVLPYADYDNNKFVKFVKDYVSKNYRNYPFRKYLD